MSPQGFAAPATASANADLPLGVVLEIAGSGGLVALDVQRLGELADDADPSVSLSGHVGSQIRIRVGDTWILGSIRNQKNGRRGDEGIVAESDLAVVGGRGIDQDIAFLDLVADRDDGALMESGEAVGALEEHERVFMLLGALLD
jgi:hypothetical protein